MFNSVFKKLVRDFLAQIHRQMRNFQATMFHKRLLPIRLLARYTKGAWSFKHRSANHVLLQDFFLFLRNAFASIKVAK